MREEGAKEHPVSLSASAESALVGIGPKTDLAQVARTIDTLALFPEIGTLYDPLYGAARPKKPVRVAYAGHYGIYYDICDDEVQVLWIEDQRRDPSKRFEG